MRRRREDGSRFLLDFRLDQPEIINFLDRVINCALLDKPKGSREIEFVNSLEKVHHVCFENRQGPICFWREEQVFRHNRHFAGRVLDRNLLKLLVVATRHDLQRREQFRFRHVNFWVQILIGLL